MSYEHDYYSDQCAGCKWAEWRGGCLNKATADDGSDLDAADRGECKHFEAGQPQRRPPQPGDRVYVHIPLAEYDALRARAEAAERELAQARADALRLVGEMYIADEVNLFRTMLDVCGVEDLRDQLDALDLKIDRFDAPGLGAAIRRALGGAQ